MNEDKISILEEYYIKVTRLLIRIIIISIFCGAVTIWVNNIFTEKNRYLILATFFILLPQIVVFTWLYKAVIVDERLSAKKFKLTKNVVIVATFVDFCTCTYFMPEQTYFEHAVFCVILSAFFLDRKMIIKNAIGLIILDIVVNVVFYMENEIVLFKHIFAHIMLVFLSLSGLIVLVYLVGDVLLNVKTKEAEYKENYYQKVEDNQKKVRELRHNLVNQIIVLKSQVDALKIAEADKIMDDIIAEVQQTKMDIYTENIAVNYMLNSKINESEIYDINWDIDINIPKKINIDMRDMGTVLGNILDNAIEACSMLKNGEKVINVNMFYKNSNIVIFIRNPKNVSGIAMNTWKRDKENHGLGLQSARKIVDKYNGIVTCEDRNTFYEVSIMMWNI